MTESVLASGSKQDISVGGDSVLEGAQAPVSNSTQDQTKHTVPKRGVLRSFTSVLGSLARALSIGEDQPETAVPLTDSSAAAQSSPALLPVHDPKIRIKPGPQLNAIRSDLQKLLVELNRDEPAVPVPSPINQLGEPQLLREEASTRRQLMFLDEALSSATDLPSAEPESSASSAVETSPIDFSPEHTAPTEAAQYAILSGKTIAVVGFSQSQSMAIGKSLAAQHCSFLTLTNTDAEFRKGAITSCDALILNVRPESVQTGSGEVSTLLATKKPALLVGDASALMGAAMLGQNNAREFVVASHPELTGETIWRTALLFSALPGPKLRAKKKNRQMQIVIGDDDPSSRTLVHAILAQEGMKCHAADNGAHALALARSKSADLLIVDVNMPGLDGFQVLAEIKRDPSLSAMRVILLTTRQAESDVLRGFGLGADDYVTKPFSPLELAARVKRLLGRNQ